MWSNTGVPGADAEYARPSVDVRSENGGPLLFHTVKDHSETSDSFDLYCDLDSGELA